MNDEEAGWDMYVPDAYRAGDARTIIAAHPFAQLVTADKAGLPYVTQTPIYFESDAPDERYLVGHLARANPQADTLINDMPVIAVFTGPDAYVSPSCYVERPTVPTWDYVSAQVRGRLTPIDDDAGQLKILDRTIMLAERANGTDWTMAHAPRGKVASLLPAIRSFRIEIEALKGAAKLHQTHPAGDRKRVADALDHRGDAQSRAIAAMIRTLPDGA